ncbi:hypothetical protein D3C76_1420550 [compost metagenome]
MREGVVDTGDPHLPPLKHRLDRFQHFLSHIIVQLHPLKAEIADFPQHGVTGSVAFNVPAS